MEERNKESLAFSVRVFTLQEVEMVEEEHRKTAKEVKMKAAEGALLYSLHGCYFMRHNLSKGTWFSLRRFYYQALALCDLTCEVLFCPAL